MGFEKNSIEIVMNNMYANAEMYARVAEAKQLQGDNAGQVVALASLGDAILRVVLV